MMGSGGWITLAIAGGLALGLAANWSRLKRALDNNKRIKEEAAAGNLIKRDTPIWEEERRYTTSVSYETLLSELSKKSYANCRADFHPNHNNQKTILFRGEGWNGMLVYRGQANGNHVFSFYYPAYREAVMDCAGDMNILLTTVEKTLISLDGDTSLTVHKLAYKTQSR
jgi:hypothetical protein